MVERRTVNPYVASSSLAGGAKFKKGRNFYCGLFAFVAIKWLIAPQITHYSILLSAL
ncbi:protein of unknown function [Vibrio tapetis subsp. tapetis]|uniref:Uncharacterized protein n=1 Tax=Vibrio tapetis subsp. tapetis TaxID=1671868 RepID=A0A2N8ZBF6_9VIBR|nr:protein of unknown function [Vibrio tapetis subsp. tapetis]